MNKSEICHFQVERLSQSMFHYERDNILDKGYSVTLSGVEKITFSRPVMGMWYEWEEKHNKTKL